MRKNYKKLGSYIQEVNIRNKDLAVDRLLGVSIKKVLMPSIANTVGTNMSNYKVVQKGQFAYGPVTSRNGDKISIALLEDYSSAIISQSYKVFEVIDENELMPEYLMMWFRRPEFDRYARFRSHGSTRETFDWEEMCEVELPIPSIEKQQGIVDEYNTVVNRIKLNEQLNQKLEEAAQALYKHWFVDFNFPITEESCPELVSESPQLIGKPYKSSGGAMEYNEELDKEIPEGWECKRFTDELLINGGGTPKTDILEYWNGSIPFFTPKDVMKSYYTLTTEKCLTEIGLLKCSSKLYKEDTIFITARGTVGAISLAGKPMAMNQSCYAFIEPNGFQYFGHQLAFRSVFELKEEAVGAVFKALVTKDFNHKLIVSPVKEIKGLFNEIVSPLYRQMKTLTAQSLSLFEIRSLLLSKMTRVDDELVVK